MPMGGGMSKTTTKPTPAALYARFSSDLQNDRSIDDQFELARGFAKREELRVVATFSDKAKTGATLFDRDGILEMRRAAKTGLFKVLVVESLDRISRTPKDLHEVFDILNFCGVEIRTVNEGTATPIHVGVRSLLGSLFLTDLGDKVRRGHSGRVRQGKVPGSVPVGYRIVAGKKGEPEIAPEQADIVRRIFKEYVQGKSPRTIAADLSKDGIKSPAGGKWNYQTFIGGGCGRFGVLTNPIYIGELVWNRSRRLLNPENGKKVKRASPEHEVRTSVPQLRIIDQPLWDAAQALRQARSQHQYPNGKKVKPFMARRNDLLAGVLRCGACGSNMRVRSVTRGVPYAACADADAHGTCSHKRTYNLHRLEASIRNGLLRQLTDPEAIAEWTRAYHAEWSERSKRNRVDAAAIKKQLNRIEVQIGRIAHAIKISDTPVAELMAQLKPLDSERAGLTERLRLVETETNVVSLHPTALNEYKHNIERLHQALSQEALTQAHRSAFRNVIDSIVVHQTPKGADYEYTPYGRLGALMGIDLFPPLRADHQILTDHGLPGVCDAGNPDNSGLPLSHSKNVVSFGRWAA